MTDALTPMMQQYLSLKQNHQDAILFFRLGDFYEMFFDDAIVASKVLEIALTARGTSSKIPMCGVPHHSVKPYIQKLISKGFKVALADQVSLPGKGLVDREVIRVITPGMVIDETILGSDNNFIAHIMFGEHGYVMAYSDISTGENAIIDGLTLADLLSQIANLDIKEVVLANQIDTALIDFLNDNSILISYSQLTLDDHKLVSNLTKNQKKCALGLLAYLMDTQKTILSHFTDFVVVEANQYMRLDHKADRHLELTQSTYNNYSNTLFHHLDNCQSAGGSRKLKNMILKPLLDIDLLNQRYDQIDFYIQHAYRSQIIKSLSFVYDITRILGRLTYDSINAKDLIYLKTTLQQVPIIKEFLLLSEHPMASLMANSLDEHQAILTLIDSSIKEDAGLTVKEGNIIKPGFNQELDELLDFAQNSDAWLSKFEEQERQRTGIKNLKVKYNKAVGYFIEVSNANLDLITDDLGYIRKRTLTNNERFITPELQAKETLILTAKDKTNGLEYQIFGEIKNQVANYMVSLQALANQLAEIDVMTNLASIAIKHRYCRPKLTKSRFVEIVNARHPIVEKNTAFVANHIQMKPHEIFLITGPNMSGKSTYMRMFALIVCMVQIGMFVPADSASLPVYDAIFTRIGSSDDLAGGKSTFMVEMLEANIALTKATENSLILFDEIGRGTATYDGLALAQGMVEYIHDHIKAQTLFSTHYHELTILESRFDNISNLHVVAKEQGNQMIFLHQVRPGYSDKSYGIQVASLAKLPPKIINRSKQILKKLENKKVDVNLFSNQKEEVIEVRVNYDEVITLIESIDINQLTPVEALVRLQYIKEKTKKK